MKNSSKNWIYTAACLSVAVISVGLQAQRQPIPMRGWDGDLSSTQDHFLSLDLNGDGRADMLYYRPGSGFASAYLSHGDGTFRKVTYTSNGNTSNGFTGDLSSPQDTFVPLDLNGDGKSDFIGYRPGSGFAFKCLSIGDGTVNCANLSTPGRQYLGFNDSMTNGAERIVAMDLNHDGRSDFIVYTPGGGYARAYLSMANGTVQAIDLTVNGSAIASVGFAEDMRPNNVRIVPIDANGDGFSDLLVYTPQYAEVRLYLNNRNATFRRVDLAYGGSRSGGFTDDAGNSNAHLIALDLNGDGRQDFLWWQAGSRVVAGYISNGAGSFSRISYQSNGSTSNGFEDDDNSTADTAVAADFDGDGRQDFFWYSPGNNTATAYLLNANGTVTGTYNGRSVAASTASNGVILPLNFLGGAASGFLSFIPGSGANQSTPDFTAYTIAETDRQSSLFGRLNKYNFYASSGSFLSDLNWSIGNVPLKGIVMPGTHDAAMYGLGGSIDANQTQWESIPDQVSDGARVLDFRVAYMISAGGLAVTAADGRTFLADGPAPTSSGFYLYGHSIALTNRSPVDVVNQLENWLLANPNEVLVLDMAGQVISGKYGNYAPALATALNATVAPQLIYTQQVACGMASCNSAAVQPQNMTIAQLQQRGTRLIFINGDLVSTGVSWGSTQQSVGYCEKGSAAASGSTTGGRSTAAAEIDCIDNGSSDSPAITAVRPTYQAADAASTFMILKGVLTPFGAYLQNQSINGSAPLFLADGNDGFNVGTDFFNLNQQFLSGKWNEIALNAVYLDGIRADNSGGDQMASLIIKRNRQTWVNKHFFNAKADNPAGALSVGPNGDVWAAGSGHSLTIFKYNPANGAWVSKINGQSNVKKLATDLQGGVWVVDGSSGPSSLTGALIHYDQNGQNATNSGSQVRDVAVGKNGSVWAVGLNGIVFQVAGPTDGSPNISGSVPSQYAVAVTVDNRGFPWVIDTSGSIRRFDGSSWLQVSYDKGNEIAAGADGSIFITGRNTPSVGRYNTQSNKFDFLQMDAAHITVEPGGQPWAIRAGSGTIYKGSLDQM